MEIYGTIRVDARRGDFFCQPGDSGSVVVASQNSQNRVVGLLWGGVDNIGAASPIADVMSELQIEVLTAEEVLAAISPPAYEETLEGKLEALLCESTRGRGYWYAYRAHFDALEHMFHFVPRLHATWRKMPQSELMEALRSGILDPDSKIPPTLGCANTAKVMETLRDVLLPYI